MSELNADGYKNLKNISMKLSPDMNIFCGENAQGKTNLIEAIWLCSGCKSFRGTRDKDYIGFGTDKAEIQLSFTDNQRKQAIDFFVLKENPKEKRITLNGVKLGGMTELFGKFKCVIFTPEDLELIKGPPEKRRLFLDMGTSQIKNNYVSAMNKYESVLSQRNALLKDIYLGRVSNSLLEIWDEQLAQTGSYISVLRQAYTQKLNAAASRLYYNLSKSKEELSITYNSTVFKNLAGRMDYKGDMKDEYIKKLHDNEKTDIRLGFTTIGTHRDEVVSKINGLNVRDFGSQGQQRSVALLFKLAQAEILRQETGEMPVVLLDDVLSELDLLRQDFVINEIQGMQVFVTCCDPTAVLRYKMGNIYFMRDGEIYNTIYK
ncbi:MAG: DNA replication/repair protein RecF [Oscillospiraceae bacterium]